MRNGPHPFPLFISHYIPSNYILLSLILYEIFHKPVTFHSRFRICAPFPSPLRILFLTGSLTWIYLMIPPVLILSPCPLSSVSTSSIFSFLCPKTAPHISSSEFQRGEQVEARTGLNINDVGGREMG